MTVTLGSSASPELSVVPSVAAPITGNSVLSVTGCSAPITLLLSSTLPTDDWSVELGVSVFDGVVRLFESIVLLVLQALSTSVIDANIRHDAVR